MAAPKRRQHGDETPKPAGRKPTRGRQKAATKNAARKAAAPPAKPATPRPAAAADPAQADERGASRRERVRELKHGREVLSHKKHAREVLNSKKQSHDRPVRHGTEWIYGRNVAALALAPGAQRRPRAVVATAAALRSLPRGTSLGALKPRIVDTEELDLLTGSRDHQGVALQVPAFGYARFDKLAGADLLVVLDEVTDPRNLGAVARSALACGAGGLILPSHRAAAVTPTAVKASAGACEHLPIAQVTNVTAALNDLKRRGFWAYGAAGEAQTSYRDLDYAGKVVLVFGSEGTGLRPLVARTCDQLAGIPVAGPLESLNVSVAAALFLYEARRCRDSAPPPTTPERR